MEHDRKSMDPPVTLRLSPGDGADAESIRSLASLDHGKSPAGPVVLAEMDGAPVAALGIGDGSLVADPVRAGKVTVFLMRLHRLEVRLIGSVWGA